MSTIWIADDSPASSSLLAFAVQEILPQARISSFGSGPEVLHALSLETLPHYLFLDVHLGMLSGLATVQRIRSLPNQPGVVIMCSSDADPTLPDLAIEAGANHFFHKPWEFATLVNILQEIL